jgi:DNA-directed RNA polymerase specialized sigma24 family protein
MGSQDFFGTSAYDSDPEIEEILVRLDPYIVASVENMARRSSNIAHPEVVDLEIDEIVQRVRIKLWKALKEKPIGYPRAYIRTIVNNEFNDIPRKRKAPLPLLADEDGEIQLGNTLVAEREGMSDPAYEFELEEGLNDWMALAAQAIAHLSPRQKRAMICLLKERIDNRIQLVEAFERHKVNIDDFAWPDNEADEIRLKASIYAARHNIAQRIGILLSEYKRRGIPDSLPPQ